MALRTGSDPQYTCRNDDRSSPASSSSVTLAVASSMAKLGVTEIVTRWSLIALSHRYGCCTKWTGDIVTSGQPLKTASTIVPMRPMSW